MQATDLLFFTAGGILRAYGNVHWYYTDFGDVDGDRQLNAGFDYKAVETYFMVASFCTWTLWNLVRIEAVS